MSGQFLTAVFELRPSRRKAAALERARAVAECVFWAALPPLRDLAEAACEIAAGNPGRADWQISSALSCRGGAAKTLAVLARDGLVENAAYRWFPTTAGTQACSDRVK